MKADRIIFLLLLLLLALPTWAQQGLDSQDRARVKTLQQALQRSRGFNYMDQKLVTKEYAPAWLYIAQNERRAATDSGTQGSHTRLQP